MSSSILVALAMSASLFSFAHAQEAPSGAAAAADDLIQNTASSGAQVRVGADPTQIASGSKKQKKCGSKQEIVDETVAAMEQYDRDGALWGGRYRYEMAAKAAVEALNYWYGNAFSGATLTDTLARAHRGENIQPQLGQGLEGLKNHLGCSKKVYYPDKNSPNFGLMDCGQTSFWIIPDSTLPNGFRLSMSVYTGVGYYDSKYLNVDVPALPEPDYKDGQPYLKSKYPDFTQLMKEKGLIRYMNPTEYVRADLNAKGCLAK